MPELISRIVPQCLDNGIRQLQSGGDWQQVAEVGSARVLAGCLYKVPAALVKSRLELIPKIQETAGKHSQEIN